MLFVVYFLRQVFNIFVHNYCVITAYLRSEVKAAMAKVEQPIFILPKKRNGKKQNSIASHVDHIITVQVNIIFYNLIAAFSSVIYIRKPSVNIADFSIAQLLY